MIAVLGACAPATPASAAFEFTWPDARTAALAGCICDPVEGLVASRSAVAGGAGRWSLELSGGELYGLPEARGWSVEASRRGPLRIAVEASGFGGDLYEERTAALVMGGAPDDGPRLDVGLRALGLSAAGTDDAWAASVDVRLAASVLGRVGIAAEWRNVGGVSIGDSPVPSPTRLGVALALEDVLLAASILVERGFDPSPSLGVEFAPVPWLGVRAGAGTRPGRFTAGTGVVLNERPRQSSVLALDVAWEWHPELGASSFVSVSLAR